MQENSTLPRASGLPRVLVPYTVVFPGGVRRVLEDGLPRLQRLGLLAIHYAEMTGNQGDMDQMEARGISVERDLGVPGPAVLSWRGGWTRWCDLGLSLPRMLRSIGRLRRALGEYEVIYAHSYRELTLCAAARRFLKSPPLLVWHCHGVTASLPSWILRWVTRSCALVIAISDDVEAQLKSVGVPSKCLRRVYNAIDLSEIRRKSALEPRPLPARAGLKVLLLPCAALRPIKGVHLAVAALAELDENVHLWVSGDVRDPASVAYQGEVQRLIADHGLGQRVHFIGLRQDIYAVMAQADAVLVPTPVREPFGLVAAEAMALEKPVLVSDRGGLVEVVGSEENAWICDPAQPKAMASAIRVILSNSEEVQATVGRGRKRVEKLFSYSRWEREISAVILEQLQDAHESVCRS